MLLTVFQKLKHTFLKPNKIAALYIQTTDHVALSVTYCLVEFKKEKAFVLKHGHFSGLENLHLHIEPNVPLVISLNGKGILHKPIDANLLHLDKIQITNKLFPNINFEEFYIQLFQTEKAGVISLVRADFVSTITFQIYQQGFSIHALAMGEYEVLAYENIFHQKTHDVSSLITAAKGCLQLQTQIDDTELNTYEYVAFCMVLSEFSNTLQHTDADDIKENKEASEEKLLFTKGGLALLITLFVILLANFIVFQYLSDKNKGLYEKQILSGGKIDQTKELEVNLKRKQQLLEEIGWSETSHASFYADRIGSTVPSGLKLTYMQIHAEDQQKSKEERRLVLQSGIIGIKGESASAMIVNDWQKKLEKQDWVRTAKVKSYQYDMQERVGKFELEVNVLN